MIMIKKKPILRVFICIIVLIMTLSFISPSLVALAADSGGSGGGSAGGGGSSGVTDDSLWDEEIGLRIYLVSKKDGKSTVVQNSYGTYYLDIWMNKYLPTYNDVNPTSRYSPAASKQNITAMSSGNFDYNINNTYGSIGFRSEIDLSDHLQNGLASSDPRYFFTESGNQFSVSGDNFYNWFMSTREVKEGDKRSVYSLVFNYLYAGKTQNINPETSFLVVEPVIKLCDPDSNFKTTEGPRIASWYGYITYNTDRGRDPGRAHSVRNRLQKLANGFRMTNTPTSKGTEGKIKDVLDLWIADTGEYSCDSGVTEWFGDGDGSGHKAYHNIHKDKGYGIQVYWLKGALKDLPIDTYDIDKKTTLTPDNAENPSDSNNNKGSKTIVKLYADLYKDQNSAYFTEIVDTASFARKNVSNLVSITDESKINGYTAVAWYSSKTAYTSDKQPDKLGIKASDMIKTTNLNGGITDGTISMSVLGGNQLRVNNYSALDAYAVGSNKYFTALSEPHGTNGTGLDVQKTTGATQFTNYKRLGFNGETVYGKYTFKKDDDTKKTVDLGDDETLVILYTRERTKLSTGDYSSSTTIEPNDNKYKDQSGNLQIVKLYGVINENTYEITNDPSKSKVVITNTTRNVNLNSESGYDLAEWIYLTGGAGTGITAKQMGDPNHYSFDGSADKAYRLDGFVDNFKNNSSYSRAFNFKSGVPTLHILSTNSDGIAETTVPGRYSIGSRSGIGSRAYNSTIYFGGDGKLADETSDSSDTNDVLYLLFLKVDQLSYSTDDLVIPQSYVTRYDNYKHNPMTVKGSVSQTTYNEYLQNHKFKYLLPVVNNKDYEDVNPLFIGQIAIKDKLQSGLIPTYSSVERLEYHGATNQHEILRGYSDSAASTTGIMSDYIQLLYIDHNKAITSSNDIANLGNILNLSAVNLEYTAYRSGDSVTAAIWKYNSINSASGGNKMLATDTGILLNDFTTMNMTSLGGSVAVQGYNKPSTTRQANDSEQNFKLNFNFSEVGNGIKNAWTFTNLKNVAFSQNIDRFKMQNVIQQSELTIGNTKLERLGNSGKAGLVSRIYFNDKGKETKAVLSQAFCNKLPSGFEKYSINSLNRLYKIKVNGNWTYAVGTTQYLNAASDISITQNVKYGVHYGSAIANPYKDDTKQGNSTDKLRQSGYVKSMKASNTISFYPYYVMQYELPSTYNAQLNKNGTKNNTAGAMNNANQLYVIGEEKRYLNVYNYAEVSFSGHTVASSKGTDIVNNVVNSNRSGRIEISSEQWSTHARANSLIGLDNCALPGGATLSITIPNDNRQTVTITSYGAFLPEQSAGYAQVKAMNDASAFGTMPTNTDAIKSRHNSLVGSVVGGFEGLNVEQYFTDTKGYTNTKDHGSTYDSANTVYNQISGELGSGKNLYDLPESKRYSVKII